MTIIGIMGRKRAGKNEFAEALQKSSSADTYIFAFADPIRDIMHAINPIIGHEDGQFVRYANVVNTRGYEAAKEYPEFRQFAQRLGTEGGRHIFGEDVWVDIVMRRIEAVPDSALCLIPDVRFRNEYAAIKNSGGIIVRIDRPDLPQDEHDSHASETEWQELKPDVIVTNNQTLEHLIQEANSLLEHTSEWSWGI